MKISRVFAVIILCCVGIIIYSNTFHSPFQFDDYSYIVENFSIRNLTKLGVIWNFWPTRFITYLSFAFNYHFNQLNVFGYHLFNLIVHLGSAILVWWFILLVFSTPAMKNKRIPKYSGLIGLFGALIFLSHPAQTESVTYIYQRTASLAGFFYLFSLCLYVKSRLLQTDGNPLSMWLMPYVFSWFVGIAGMFTKENTVTLPLMIVLSEICFFKTGKSIKWKYTVPFLIILLIIPILLFYTKPTTFKDIQRLMDNPVNAGGYYFLTQLRVMITYIRLLFIPLNQNLDYDYPVAQTLMELPTLTSLFLLAIILFSAIRIFSRYRLVSFSIFWFFLTLLPESNIIPLEDVIFEHRLYLPMVGYSLFLVGITYYCFGRNTLRPMVIILLMLITCYSIFSYRRNFIWKDKFTLWNDTVRKSPHKARPYYNRGNAYADRGNFDQAITDYNKAIEINPNFVAAYYNRGNIYTDRGNFDQAITDYNKAIEINPNYAKAYLNRGNAYADRGNFDQAITDYNKAIEINPNYAKAYYNRGNAYAKKDNLKQAITDYTRAIQINPNYADAYYNRGIIYFLKQEYSKSGEDVHKAEVLGYRVSPEFFDELKKASKRER